MNSLHFKISGTHCPACKRLIERRISGIDGVKEVSVNFETGETEVKAEKLIAKSKIQKVLEGAEYKVL